MRAVWRRLLRQWPVPIPGIEVSTEDGETHVDVEIAFPYLSKRGRARYRLTTENLPLDTGGFPSAALRDSIARGAAKPRHRALFCWDYDRGITLAALTFHVDERNNCPLIITRLAIRQGELNAKSLFAVWMLLDVLQDVALRASGRNDDEIGAIAVTPSDQAHLREIGLRPCPRPAVLRWPGTWFCYPRARPKT
jgi:hypothetical protein